MQPRCVVVFFLGSLAFAIASDQEPPFTEDIRCGIETQKSTKHCVSMKTTSNSRRGTNRTSGIGIGLIETCCNTVEITKKNRNSKNRKSGKKWKKKQKQKKVEKNSKKSRKQQNQKNPDFPHSLNLFEPWTRHSAAIHVTKFGNLPNEVISLTVIDA